MRIGQLRTIIEGLSDDEEMYVAIYDKDEAEEYIMNNLCEGEEQSLTDDEWQTIVIKMADDEGVWTELSESFRYHVENVWNKRKGNDDNSK